MEQETVHTIMSKFMKNMKMKMTPADSLEGNKNAFSITIHQLLFRYCDHMSPPTLFSTTNQLTVLFRTDISVSAGGFISQWRGIDPTMECDRTFVESSGFIESPDFPVKITRAMQCQYHVQVSNGLTIMVSVLNISLPCSVGYIEIRYDVSNSSQIYRVYFASTKESIWLYNM